MGHIAKTHPDDVHMLVDMRESDMLADILSDINNIKIDSDREYDYMLTIITIKIVSIFDYIKQMRA